MDGLSLVPLLKRHDAGATAFYWHYPHYGNQGGAPGGAVRVGDYKLIEFYEDNRVELYNLRDDLGEQNDLAAEMPDKAAELRRMLHQWRSEVGALMPTPNPNLRLKTGVFSSSMGSPSGRSADEAGEEERSGRGLLPRPERVVLDAGGGGGDGPRLVLELQKRGGRLRGSSRKRGGDGRWRGDDPALRRLGRSVIPAGLGAKLKPKFDLTKKMNISSLRTFLKVSKN